jgi:hypothetical protein
MKAVKWIILSACLLTGATWHTADAQSLSACQKGQIGRDGSCQDQPPALSTSEERLVLQSVPAPFCRAEFGYFQVGPRLCMTGLRGPTSYGNAEAVCKTSMGRVADYSDWRYRILFGDGIAAQVGWWLGPITGDNLALFVNLPNTGDFDGETNRFESRFYACAHDDSF